MKRIILTLALISTLGLSTVSCSTDDSGLDTTTNADDLTNANGNGSGDAELPRPVPPRL